MRIIAGDLGGRLFDSPGTFRTHPMSDKMRGALFNILGDVEGLTVLDAFAGSGALSFEAVSRGAASAVAIDSDKAAQRTIAANIAALGLGSRVKFIAASAQAWRQTNSAAAFDIVLCDPPYDHLQRQALGILATAVKPEGILVLSWPGNEAPPALPGLAVIEQRSYGDAQLLFYRAESR